MTVTSKRFIRVPVAGHTPHFLRAVSPGVPNSLSVSLHPSTLIVVCCLKPEVPLDGIGSALWEVESHESFEIFVHD